MPIYEYRCLECNTSFEKLLTSSSSTETIVCDRCGSPKVQKKVSAASLRLAGSSGGTIPAGALSGCSSRSGFS